MTDMNQQTTEQTEQTEQTERTYLDSLQVVRPDPEPRSETDKALDLVKLREEQSKLLLEKVSPLTVENPTVSIDLDAPLDSQLEKELYEKGFGVATSYQYTSVNGKQAKRYSVTVTHPDAAVSQGFYGLAPFRYNLGYGTDLTDLLFNPFAYSRPWSRGYRSRLGYW